MGRPMGQRRARRWAMVAAALGGLLAPLAASTAGEAASVRTRVTVIGDSTLLGMRNDGAAVIRGSYDLNLQAASCRRLIAVSCDIPFRPTNTIDVMRAQEGQLGTALVIMAGYDDFVIADGIDTIVAEARRQGVSRVVWLTYMEDVIYTGLGGLTYADVFREHNRVLRAKAAADPILSVADWNAYADPHPEWFSSDGIHLSAAGSPALGTYIRDQLDALSVSRCAAGVATGAVVPSGAPAAPSAGAVGFHAVTPTRLLDTRTAAPLAAERQLTVDAGAVVGAGATAVAVNITAAPACVTGFVTAYPCGGGRPATSNVNPAAGSVVAGFAIVPLTAGGTTFCLSSLTQADVVVDITGWYGTGGDGLTPLSPRRLLDTRTAGTRLAAGAATAVTTPAVPGGAAVLNLTMTEPAAAGFLTAYPAAGDGSCDPAARPLASAVNAAGGATVANLAQVGAGGNGVVCLYASVATHVVVDVTGTYGPADAALRAVTPTRLVDTRTTGRTVGGAATLAVRVPQDTAAAAALTVTAVDSAGPAYVTVWPADATGVCAATARPLASSLNVTGPAAVPNLVVVATGGNRTVCVFAQASLHLVVDQTAWFEDVV